MNRTKKGFVLPTILIVGTVLFFILAYAINATITAQGLITTSQRQMLARQAAESGIAYARSCIVKFNRTVKWTEEKPLRPNTDCLGNIQAGLPEYVAQTNSYRSSFEVKPSDVADSYKTVSARGLVDLLNKQDGSVLNSLDFRMSAYIKTDVTFDDVVFGSLYIGNGYNDLYSRAGQSSGFSRSVYFFTKTHMGKISSVGYNMDGVLTGYLTNNVIPWSLAETTDPKKQYETPYELVRPSPLSPADNVAIRKIVTDFQGNGWVTFFIGEGGRVVYGTGSNINCDLGTGRCDGAENGVASRPIWRQAQSKMDLSGMAPDEKVEDIRYVASTFVLTDKGRVYANGRSGMGPGMGLNYVSSGTQLVNKPTLIAGYDGFNTTKRIKIIDADSQYYGNGSGGSGYLNHAASVAAVAVSEDGDLFAWGKGMISNVRALKTNTKIDRVPRIILRSGYEMSGVVAGKIISATTDGSTIWAIDSNGRVWAAGSNIYGQTGLNAVNETINYFYPVSIPNSEKVTKIAADGFSVLFLTEPGNVYGAGLNNKSQLGFPYNSGSCSLGYGLSVACQRSPKQFELPADKKAQDIFIVSPGIYRSGSGSPFEKEADNYRNSYVITTDGQVYGAGSNKHGQLGVGTKCQGEPGFSFNPPEYARPQQMVLDYGQNNSGVAGDEDKVVKAKYVRAGIGTAIVITDLNHVFTVGNNQNGQLGSGDTNECHVPKRHRYTNVFQTWYY